MCFIMIKDFVYAIYPNGHKYFHLIICETVWGHRVALPAASRTVQYHDY